MVRPTQQTFSASLGSSLKSGLYLSHFYSGEERLLRSNSSQRVVIKIPLIIPPLSHKKIRRILGWLLLPLSNYLVPTSSTKSTLIWVHLMEIRWEYAQITQMYPAINSPTCIPQNMGSPSLPQMEIHPIVDC